MMWICQSNLTHHIFFSCSFVSIFWSFLILITARTYFRNLGQRSILVKKGPKNLSTPFSIPFQGALLQNKVLHNFRKRGQHSIVERKKGLD